MKTALLKGSVLSLLLLHAVDAVCADDPFATTPTSAPAAESATVTPADPWEGFNRSMFRFNQGADKYLLKPVAKFYVKATPNFFRRGVNNVFANLMEVPSVLNGVLQGNFRGAAHDTGRLLVNTTIGLAGVLDVAQHMGLKPTDREDFGQTLAAWGVNSGPYVVLPFLGPSTLRDSAALPVDWYTDPIYYVDHVPTRNTTRAFSVTSTRANLLPLEKNITGDKYIFVRDAYLQHRDFLIKNGEVEDGFGADEQLEQDSGY